MSKILEAIDEEIAEGEERLDAVLLETGEIRARLEQLGSMRRQAEALNGGPPLHDEEQDGSTGESSDDPPASPSSPPRTPAKQEPAPTVSDEERTQRGEQAADEKSKIMAFVREHGGITYAQCAELLDVHPTTARSKLIAIARTSGLESVEGEKSGPGRAPRVFRLELAQEAANGGRTPTEAKLIEVVTEDGPIDEVTLAARAGVKSSSARTILTGLLSRKVLVRREEEGVTLFEVAG